MTLEELIDAYKSQRAIAKEFGFSQQRVNKWFLKGEIPEDAQYKIAYISGGKFRIDNFESEK